jgi:5'-methylthioinosine phosphorylase
MADLAIIGGTGLTSLEGFGSGRHELIATPWGDPSGPLVHGRIAGRQVVFIARHGPDHTIPPHRVNYRANIWALRQVGARNVIAVAAVGGIGDEMLPGRLVIPDQIIDYTYSRHQTFFEQDLGEVVHVDFTEPYCGRLRDLLIGSARELGYGAVEKAVYAATQGPRLETAAEIDRLEQDGCSIVGMTGMPEAVLARELELCYATCAVIANRAAGRAEGPIRMDDIRSNLVNGMSKVYSLLQKTIPMA